ncbi:DUF1385 domain-containing protein [Candidatus Poribacteria bacterium]|nr:DUF1385 domain-containing protein [Candidatus Poribacteria bacterium]
MNNPSCAKPKNVGGQAVIEGVMMRAPRSLVVAVRKPNNEIVVKREKLKPLKERFRPLGWPVIRGVGVLIESLVWGMRALTFSANQALEEENDESDQEKPKQEMGGLSLAFTFMLSILLGIGLFVIIPERLASLFSGMFSSNAEIIFNVSDGFIRLIIFLLYVWIISRSKYIARVFEYHGAEHKSIHAYEAGEELTEENVAKHSPQHPRCGTAFLMTVMLMGIIVFSIFGKPDSIFVRIGSRLLLIPFIAGISYEIIKLMSKKQNSKFMRVFMFPGLWLQKLTTKEPSKDQIQVAIRSLQEVLTMEKATQE